MDKWAGQKNVHASCAVAPSKNYRMYGRKERERESSVEVKGMGSVALSELSIIRDVPSIKHYVACFTLVLLCPFQFT